MPGVTSTSMFKIWGRKWALQQRLNRDIIFTGLPMKPEKDCLDKTPKRGKAASGVEPEPLTNRKKQASALPDLNYTAVWGSPVRGLTFDTWKTFLKITVKRAANRTNLLLITGTIRNRKKAKIK